ncbi:MAG: DivIVA domain-containing protein [Oscillospiraceae bacterium]|nr:DivIVA domain-containing protein [Oscillospiraceae bacterium]
MVTAQDIREKTFEKAKKADGYNMDQVDEFLDELAAAFTSLAKENASLKGKLRVMAEKVDEYRQTEDSMRLALLSAQKLSAQIESEAKERADSMLAEAKDTADRLTRQATDSVANEQAKLEEAKKATDKFFEHMRVVCEKQIAFYEKLSTMQLVGGDQEPEAKSAAPAKSAPKTARDKAVEDTVRSIEASAVTAALDEPDAITVDTDLPEEEEEPTRLFPMDNPPKKKKRSSFDDFSFDDEDI